MVHITEQRMKFCIKEFFSKCDQIRSFLRIWSHLLTKSLRKLHFFVQCITPAHLNCQTRNLLLIKNLKNSKRFLGFQFTLSCSTTSNIHVTFEAKKKSRWKRWKISLSNIKIPKYPYLLRDMSKLKPERRGSFNFRLTKGI